MIPMLGKEMMNDSKKERKKERKKTNATLEKV